MKERAIRICKDIENTLSTMEDKKAVNTGHPLYPPTKVSRTILETKLKQLKRKYNIK